MDDSLPLDNMLTPFGRQIYSVQREVLIGRYLTYVARSTNYRVMCGSELRKKVERARYRSLL